MKILVLSHSLPQVKDLCRVLRGAGFEVIWTDSGPEAICEAVDGKLAACIVVVGRGRDREIDYLPCLNRVDQRLPVLVVNDLDTVAFQRRLRRHRVFYYLIDPFNPAEILAALDRAVASSVT